MSSLPLLLRDNSPEVDFSLWVEYIERSPGDAGREIILNFSAIIFSYFEGLGLDCDLVALFGRLLGVGDEVLEGEPDRYGLERILSTSKVKLFFLLGV